MNKPDNRLALRHGRGVGGGAYAQAPGRLHGTKRRRTGDAHRWAEPLEPRQLLAGVVISEIMYHPGYGAPGSSGYVPENVREEYVELYNTGPTPARLAGWHFNQGIDYALPDLTLAPGEFLVVAADLDAFIARYPAVQNVVGAWTDGQGFAHAWTGQLGNNGEDLELENELGQRVDLVSYSSEGEWANRRRVTDEAYPSGIKGWDWVSGADAGGKSLELINPGMSNDYGQNWAPSLVDGGTPGAANSVAAADIAPLISNVRHLPVIPQPTDPVTITARILDELGTSATVYVYWRLDGTADFAATPMFDDGQHGEGIAGDGQYGAVLPAQADKTIVEFYVQATDAGGLTRTWPAPSNDEGTEHAANALYQVDSTTYDGGQPIYRFVIPQAEYDAWYAQMGRGHPADYSNAMMNATFISVDGTGSELRYQVGVRNRGEGTRARTPHNFQVHFPRDHSWHDLTAISLNTQYTWSQAAGNAIFSMAGLPAPYGKPVQVRVNGLNLASSTGRQYGSYFQLEPYNTEWAEHHFPQDSSGNIYKGTMYGTYGPADLRWVPNSNPNAADDWYTRAGYSKETNKSANDWSDLLELLDVLNNTPDELYTQEVSRVINVDEWLGYFAVNFLIGNRENSLGGTDDNSNPSVVGDDYSLYRGMSDPRFQLLVHDLDTVLGQGDTAGKIDMPLFPTWKVAAIDKLLKWNDFAPRYFQILKRQIETTFSPQVLNPLLDQLLGGWIPAGTIQDMKDFAAQRNAFVLSQIPSALTVSSALDVQGGFYRTVETTTSLTGTADAIRTRRVLVNGVEATYTAWKGQWTIDNLALPLNGINRVLVETLDETGVAFASAIIDIWRDTGAMTGVSGQLPAGATTWTAANSPYHVTGTVTVPAGATLVIEPGVTVFFDGRTSLVVNGRLDAQGADEQRRISLTKTPGAADNWGGVQFSYSSYSPLVNRLAYVNIDYADYGSQGIKGNRAQVHIDHLRFGHHTKQYITLDFSSAIVTNSYFPDITGAELFHYHDFPANGYALIQGNYFGRTTGYNDIIDFTGGQRPGPIALFLDNWFAGGGDDAIDLDSTDAHIEGNVFMHFHQESPRESQSHGVTTGNDTGEDSEVTIVRNLFYDMDHAILIKDGGSGMIVNNTFVDIYNKIPQATTAAINLYEVRPPQYQGNSVYVEGNIFHNISRLFENSDWAGHPVSAIVNNNILPVTGEPVQWSGSGNLAVDPLLRNTTNVTNPRVDFALLPDSPAIGRGPNGRDMGGLVPAGASIAGEPSSPTWRAGATLTVGGPEIYAYKYRVNDGPWSAEMGQLKTVNSLTRSGSVATAIVPGHGYSDGDVVDIYGALQHPYNGTFTIFNVTPTSFAYTVEGSPAATAVGTIVVRRHEPIVLSELPDGPYTVHVIAKNSAGVWQDESAATASRTWTVDSARAPRVRLNEILALNASLEHLDSLPDMIELYNDGPGPLDLSGMSLSDSADAPAKFVFPDGATIGEGQYLVLYADDLAVVGELHLGFSLKAEGDDLYLFDRPVNGQYAVIDAIEYGPQIAGLSIGRLGDGQWKLTVPTFGSANVAQPLGDPRTLRINEWLTDASVLFADDFIELYNPQGLPVAAGGMFLTDIPVDLPRLMRVDALAAERYRIRPLSFIPAQGFAVYQADSNPGAGADHVDFKLEPQMGMIGLLDADGGLIDQVVYGNQSTDLSQGRTPDGNPALAYFPIPLPGVANPGIKIETTETVFDIIADVAADTGTWRYYDQGEITDPAWTGLSYDDDSWDEGLAVLYYKAGSTQTLAAPIRTTLAGNPDNRDSSNRPRPYSTYYFRRQFDVAGDPSLITHLSGKVVLDDGAVLYLNGVPLGRINVDPNVTVGYNTRSQDTIDAASSFVSFSFPLTGALAGVLRQTGNVLAVEVKQANSTSSDIAWGSTLQARQVTTTTIVTNNVPENIVKLMKQLRITELLYNPIGDSRYEFVELKNTGATSLDLDGVRLAGGIDFVFPAMSLAGGQYVIVAADTVAFTQRYGAGHNLAGQYSGHLSNGGDSVILRLPDPYDAAVLRFDYSPAWHPATYVQGRSLVILDSSAAPKTWSDRDAWRASVFPGGSPGGPDVGQLPGSVVISEVMGNTENPAGGWIEILNTTAEPIDIAGWHLSDSQADLYKFRIDPPTPGQPLFLQPGQHLVFTQLEHFGNPAHPGAVAPFTLAAEGAVYLSGPDYRESLAYGPSDPEVSFGHYVKSDGNVDFVATSSPTPGQPNAYPAVGPVVITELMYHPLAGDEYIELHNISGSPVTLYDPLLEHSAWQFTSGISYSFAQNIDAVRIASHGYLLVVPIAPAEFRARYGVPAEVPIVGPYEGKLDNAGERVALSRPGALVAPGVPAMILVDAVAYDNSAPWPPAADGAGPSLARVGADKYGNDVANWSAAAPSPGHANYDLLPPTVSIVPIAPDPRDAGIESMTFTFSEPVSGFDRSDLRLSRYGVDIPLTGQQTLETTNGITWTLGNLLPLTWQQGQYTLTLTPANSGIEDYAGHALQVGATETFTVTSLVLVGASPDDSFEIEAMGSSLRLSRGGAAIENIPLADVASISLHAGRFAIDGDLAGRALTVSGSDPANPTSATFHALQRLGSLSLVGNARAALAPGGQSVLAANALDLGPDATLDLADNALIVHCLPDDRGEVLQQLVGYFQAGQLHSSLASAYSALAISPNDDGTGAPFMDQFRGIPVTVDDVLLRLTYKGDANLDGVVNADDYFLIDSGYISQRGGHYNGDFNYDEVVNADDYFLIDSAYIGQGAPMTAGNPLFGRTPIAPWPSEVQALLAGAAQLW